jgi:hypothetical protein
VRRVAQQVERLDAGAGIAAEVVGHGRKH